MLRPLPREWFTVQLRFAERAATIVGVTYEEAVRECTNCCRAFGLSEHGDPADPSWQEFLRGLRVAEDRAEWAYRFALSNRQGAGTAAFGCFDFDYEAETREIGLHFLNNDPSPLGALSKARLPERRRELRAMFEAIALAHPEAVVVRGTSWLYGIEAYRRLYPPAYWQTAIQVATETEFQYMALWGQFLGRDAQVKRALAEPFLAAVERARTVEELAAAFLHGVYEVECGIEHFYAFYDVGNARDVG
jgi:hypothetical protein